MVGEKLRDIAYMGNKNCKHTYDWFTNQKITSIMSYWSILAKGHFYVK